MKPFSEQAPVKNTAGLFLTTRWSLVLAAGRQDSPLATDALEQLCRSYWYPLYLYVRRRRHSPEDSQDLTQQFFSFLLRKDYLRLADPRRGRFRTFLLHALEHFMINEWKRERCMKRGGAVPCLSFDSSQAETRYAREFSGPTTPERAYERRWAMTLLENVLDSLQQEYTSSGRGQLFEHLGGFLWGKDTPEPYAKIAERLGISTGATRAAMHRLRQRYRERLRGEVAHTVCAPEDVDEELHYLIGVVSQIE